MPKRSLQQRWFYLASTMGICSAVLVSGVYVYGTVVHRDSIVAGHARLLGVLATTDDNRLRADPQELEQSLSSAARNSLITAVCAYGADGQLASTYQKPGQPSCVDLAVDAAGYKQQTELIGSGATQARIEVYRPASLLLALFSELMVPVLTIISLLTIAVLLLARYLARAALTPIRQLTEALENSDPEEPDTRAVASNHSDMDALMDAFNRTLERLLQSRHDMAEEVERRRAAQAAESSARELLRSIFDLVPCLIFARRASGELIFANQAVAQLYQTSLDALLDGSFQQNYAGLRPDGLLFDQHASTTHGQEVWFSGLDSDTRRFLINRVPYLEDGTVLIIGVDLTREHNLQMQLQFSQRLEVIGTLAGGLAHDFNNLLTPILGYTSLLQATDLPDAAKEKLTAVEVAAGRARDLVRQILTFSRQQQTVPDHQQVKLEKVVSEAVNLIRASFPPTIEIEVDCEDSLEAVVDSSQLHQIVVNLCTNAAQAIRPAAGSIRVHLSQLGPDSDLIPPHMPRAPYALIEVSDSGRGMSRDIINHIFEPFFTTKDVGEGSGLGLSVVHGIVTSHGGDISVTSEEDRGSRFRVLLPLNVAETPLGSTHTQRSIMLIDDEEASLRVTRQLLEAQGYQAETFGSPVSALHEFRSNPNRFDIVLTDHKMPEMTGAELARAIRTIRPEIPIIMMTGIASQATGEFEGIDRKLTKPVAARELSLVIQQSLAARHHAA